IICKYTKMHKKYTNNMHKCIKYVKILKYTLRCAKQTTLTLNSLQTLSVFYPLTLRLFPSGVQTGSCVRFDVLKKTCEVSAWCPIEAKTNPPRYEWTLLSDHFHFWIFWCFFRRNILPQMNDAYLRSCTRKNMVDEAGESFSQMAIEVGGVIGIQIRWDCNLTRLMHRCLPSNKTLYPGLKFRRTSDAYKAFGIRFDIMVFGQGAGRFSFIQLILYIGSTLSYYALTTVLLDWLINTSCYSADVGENYAEMKVESVRDRQKCILCVSYVDDNYVRLVKPSQKKSLQDVKALSLQLRKVKSPQVFDPPVQDPLVPCRPAWCRCGRCVASSVHQEELCCRRGDGACITSSPLFQRLVLSRPLLEAVLQYRDPLWAPADPAAALRHCAYRQYIRWRVGVPPDDAHPVIPSCCVRRIRDKYPSPDGKYSGLRTGRKPPTQT
uniref:P2X purinoceptor n=1 Tax=Sphaeramia orbicularis TaxID=375764 RepID=A0A672Z0X4_9TELE